MHFKSCYDDRAILLYRFHGIGIGATRVWYKLASFDCSPPIFLERKLFFQQHNDILFPE